MSGTDTDKGAGFLPYGRHCIDEDDVAAVVTVLRSDWLTTGPVVEDFEHQLATAVDALAAVTGMRQAE